MSSCRASAVAGRPQRSCRITAGSPCRVESHSPIGFIRRTCRILVQPFLLQLLLLLLAGADSLPEPSRIAAGIAVSATSSQPQSDDPESISTSTLSGPRFLQEPPNYVEFSNSTGSQVQCAAAGNPPPTVHWLAPDGERVLNVSTGSRRLRTVYANGSLHFERFRADDYAQEVHSLVYRCAATNLVGTVLSRPVQVRAVVLQVYEAQVYDDFVMRGNTAILRCQIPSFVSEYVKVTSWTKEPDDDDVLSKNDSKYTVLPYGELYIHEVESSDGLQGYRCRTLHKLTGEQKSSATLGNVMVAETTGSVSPRITDSKSTVQVRKGETAVLPCSAQGLPPPQYVWYRKSNNGQLLTLPLGGTKYAQNHGVLTLTQAEPGDAGVYVCAVRNSIGDEKVETNLVLTESLVVHVEPRTRTVERGKSTSFRCVTSGFPVLSLTWLRNGKELVRPASVPGPPEARDVLTLEAVGRQHAGVYQCFVRNAYETVQATAELRLGDSGPDMIREFSEELRQPLSGVTLRCSAVGNPAPTFSWTLDGQPLPGSTGPLGGAPGNAGSDRVRVRESVEADGSVTSQVTIAKLQVDDGGLYKCVAANKAGRSEHAARLNVYGLPFIRALPKVTAVEGSNISLSCPTSGYPIDAINWLRGDLKVPLNHRQKVFPNGTLLVTNVQRGLDAGKYTCEASNNQGQSSRRDFEVLVLVPPKIIPFSFQDDQIYEGMRVSVFCAISQGEFPMSIAWYKDEAGIPARLSVNTQTVEKYGSTLSIERVTSAHGGTYTCSATNAAATVNYTAHLTVNVPPRWLVEPKDVSVLAGREVRLECQADGFPPPAITWMKANDESAGDFTDALRLDTRFTVDAGNTLLIRGVHENDQGRYMCKASNGIGAGQSKVVAVNVQVPSRFDVKNRNVTVRKGEDAQLSCTARGDLPLEIIWRNSGKSVAVGSRFKLREYKLDRGMTSHLIINKADRTDSSNFSCVAKNPFGHDEMYIYLFILERPEPPHDLWVSDHGSRSAQLAWARVLHGNSPVTGYVIQHKTSAGNWSSGYSNRTVSLTESSVVLQSLRPATTYQARVLALNELGTSEPSKVVSFTTAEEAPGGPPREIKVEAIDSQTLKVTWKAPKKETWNGNIRGYHVGFKLYNSSDPHVFKTVQLLREPEGGESSLQLTALRRFTRYGIVVKSFNDHGNGPDSDEIVAVTAEDVPNQSPSSLQCVPVSSQSLHVFWESPPPSAIHGVLQGYKVLYRRAEERYDDEPDEIKMTSMLKTMLHGLQRYSNYSVRVLAFTRVGDGVRSDPVYCRTQEDVPSAPAAVKAVASSADSILVTWRTPPTSNGDIVRYTVYMRTVAQSNEETTKFQVPPTSTSKEVKGLRRNLVHEFWVTASTRIGEGQSTKVVAQNTSGSFVPARIASLGERVTTMWQADVRLECVIVGTPRPELRWSFGGVHVQSRGRTTVGAQGTLLVRTVQSDDAGNYTCHVSNDYGSDAVVYQLLVEVPPEPPTLTVVATSMTSLKIQWRRGADGGRPLRGYVLNFRPEFGHWSEVAIEPEVGVHSLTGLQCGTRYQLFMVAINKIGSGAPSTNVTTRTKGAVPEAPPKEKLILENSTYITLRLDNWHDGGCPILYFVVEYKQRAAGGAAGYTLVSNNVKPESGRFVVADLASSTWYSLRMTAHSSAGSHTAVYDFVTLSIMGDSPPSMNMQGSKENPNLPFDIRIIILTVVALVVLVVLLVLICFWFQRKKTPRNESEKKFVAHRTLLPHHFPPSVNHVDPSHVIITSNSIDNCHSKDNINPYATSQILHVPNAERRCDQRKMDGGGGGNEDMRNNTFTPLAADGYPTRYPAINELYAKVEKPTVQLCAKHHMNEQETEVPDLLEHSLESSSSNESSPQRSYKKSYRALELIDRQEDWTRVPREDRFFNESAETTFIYNSKHELQGGGGGGGGTCSDLRDDMSEAECDREEARRFRQANSYLIDYSRRLINVDDSTLISRRYIYSSSRQQWKPACNYLLANRRYDDQYNVPI